MRSRTRWLVSLFVISVVVVGGWYVLSLPRTASIKEDLNVDVPMRDGKVTDTTRMERVLPTIRELQKRNAKVMLLSHFGRPKGKAVPEMSLITDPWMLFFYFHRDTITVEVTR